ncbi:hypothetical protein J5N97_003658 [Dioscorea zingiberensis]|uniref:Uncharacterized protein n=1 Tax=Dioscorea zingiberensis TaxID=325984 RepID=A0A9D5D6J6_9LILI|nr:hypothetical protein J5N97_003658 [Dioscorea zingiberensis]
MALRLGLNVMPRLCAFNISYKSLGDLGDITRKDCSRVLFELQTWPAGELASTPRSLKRSFVVKASSLPLVGNPALDFEAEAVFDQEFIKHRPSSSFNSPFWTTNSGAPVWNNNSSLTVGSRG